MRVYRQTCLGAILGVLFASGCSSGATEHIGHGLSATEKRLRAEAGFSSAVSSYTNTLLTDVYKAMAAATAATAPQFSSFAKQPTTSSLSIDTTPELNVITRGSIDYRKTAVSIAAGTIRYDVNFDVHSTWANGYFPYGDLNLASEGSLQSKGTVAVIEDGKSLVFSGSLTETGDFVVGADSHPVQIEVKLTRLGASYRGTLDQEEITGHFALINETPPLPGDQGSGDNGTTTPPAVLSCSFSGGPRFGQCWDYTGKSAASASHDSCYANDGTEEVSACSTANRLGTCTKFAGTPSEMKIRYSVLQWGDSTASLNCTSVELGTWVSP